MGWELRHGNKWYLYRNRRVDGKPRKEYLAAQNDRFGIGFGEVMADELERLQRLQAEVRDRKRQARADTRAQIDGLLSTTTQANAELRTVTDGLLCSMGYHKHHRGEWRMKRETGLLKSIVE